MLQRVSSASVAVGGEIVGRIDGGLLVLLGVMEGDTDADLAYVVDKTLGLRIFADEEGRMNRDVVTSGGALLVVSQFTLAGDCRRGRRPSWDAAAPPDVARGWYERAIAMWRDRGIPVETGTFQASMQVALVNDGPVTVMLDSRRLF